MFGNLPLADEICDAVCKAARSQKANGYCASFGENTPDVVCETLLVKRALNDRWSIPCVVEWRRAVAIHLRASHVAFEEKNAIGTNQHCGVIGIFFFFAAGAATEKETKLLAAFFTTRMKTRKQHRCASSVCSGNSGCLLTTAHKFLAAVSGDRNCLARLCLKPSFLAWSQNRWSVHRQELDCLEFFPPRERPVSASL